MKLVSGGKSSMNCGTSVRLCLNLVPLKSERQYPDNYLHKKTTRVLLLGLCCIGISTISSLGSCPISRGLTIKHLALRTKPITLRDQIINLLSSLQYALNCLMQYNLRLVQLLLDLHDAISLMRILVLDYVIL